MFAKKVLKYVNKVVVMLLVVALVLIVTRDTIFSYEIDCMLLLSLISACLILEIFNDLLNQQYRTKKMIALVDLVLFAIFILFCVFLFVMRKKDTFEELMIVNRVKIIIALVQFGFMLLKSYLRSSKFRIKHIGEYDDEDF